VAQPKTEASELFKQLESSAELSPFVLRRIEQEAQKLLNESPGVAAEGWAILGVVAGRRGDNEKALEYLSKALRLWPDHMHIRYQVGIALTFLDRTDEAMEYLASVDPELIPGFGLGHHHCLMAELHFRHGEIEEANESYRLAVENIDSDSPGFLITLAECAAMLGNHEQAIELAARSVAISSGVALGDADALEYLRRLGAIEQLSSPIAGSAGAVLVQRNIRTDLPWHPASLEPATAEDQQDDLAVYAGFAPARHRANAAAHED
jgi:tetratricopeptide (TPR) repeat protein